MQLPAERGPLSDLYAVDGRKQQGLMYHSSGQLLGTLGKGTPMPEVTHDELVQHNVHGLESHATKAAGEFDELPTTFRRNIVVVLPDGRVVVKDLSNLHIFSPDGRPRERIPLGKVLIRSITSHGDGVVLLERDHSVEMDDADWANRIVSSRNWLTRWG